MLLSRIGNTGLVCLLAALTLCLAGPSAHAGKWAKKLGLTDAQTQQIRTIRWQGKRNLIQLRARIQLANMNLQQVLGQQRPDKAKVLQAIDAVGALHLKLKKDRILQRLRIQAVLTPQQFTTWKQMQTARIRRRKMRRMRRMRRLRRMRRMRGIR